METNTLGPLRVCRAFIPLMMKSEHARIINLTSDMGLLRNLAGDAVGYRLSKAALNAVTRILACELENTGISVYAVSPGWTRTDMGGPGAPRSVPQGAETVVWAALSENLPTGGLFQDKHEIEF